MTRPARTTFVSLCLPLCLWGCRPKEEAESEFRNAVPRKETVEMTVPAAAGQRQQIEAVEQALKGQTAGFYTITRAVSTTVNGGGAFVLLLVREIVNHPPTKLEADGATWGPWAEALDPIEWMMTVKRVGDNRYEYKFDGRAKNSQGAFVTVLSGTHTPALDASGLPRERYGAGSFTLDWNKRNLLPMPEKDVGQAHYTYTHNAPGAGVSVDAKFVQVRDDDRPGQLVDVDYKYRSDAIAGGSMEFSTSPKAMMNVGARWSVNSRWLPSGAGRSDVKASGGDVPAGTMATANECWDIHFSSHFLRASWVPLGGWGTEDPDCVIKGAVYSDL